MPLSVVYGLEDIGIGGYYLLTGKSKKDVLIERSLQTMPEEMYIDAVSTMGLDDDKNHSVSITDSEFIDLLNRLIKYGSDHYDDEKVREIPEFHLFTDSYELYRADLIRNHETNDTVID